MPPPLPFFFPFLLLPEQSLSLNPLFNTFQRSWVFRLLYYVDIPCTDTVGQRNLQSPSNNRKQVISVDIFSVENNSAEKIFGALMAEQKPFFLTWQCLEPIRSRLTVLLTLFQALFFMKVVKLNETRCKS